MTASLLPGCGDDPPPLPEAPDVNILILSLDSTRRDLLSCYGYRSPFAPEALTSPNIDRLAREGVLFENAYAGSSWTLTSHMGLWTGQPPLVHGVELDYFTLDRDRVSLPMALSAKGYRTAGFYTGPYLDPQWGFGRGFDRYEQAYGQELTQAKVREAQARADLEAARAGKDTQAIERATLTYNNALVALDRASHTDRSSKYVTDKLLAELDAMESTSQPWFLFGHYFDPHYDYDPPAPFDTLFDPDYAGDMTSLDFHDSPRISKRILPPPESDPEKRERVISDRDLQHIEALYAGELAWTDQQIGRILQKLEETGQLDKTIVVILADHGDEFFEHGNIGHRKTLYEEVVRVPMIIRYPERFSAGKRVAALASLIDVYPTLFETLNLPMPQQLAGRSLVDVMDGRSNGEDRTYLGRLVKLGAPQPLLDGKVQAQQVFLREAFIQWPIKVVRWRWWPQPIGNLQNLDPTQRETLLKDIQKEYFQDRVKVWIDLEKTPEELPDQWSRDFSNPSAARALEAYVERYAELSKQRGNVTVGEMDPATESILRGLGYTDGARSNDTQGLFKVLQVPPPAPPR
ncbi:MAG: sulfatase [Planctomycetes bacterium]|nr:sulfatase [Planctomycetota bacterium]